MASYQIDIDWFCQVCPMGKHEPTSSWCFHEIKTSNIPPIEMPLILIPPANRTKPRYGCVSHGLMSKQHQLVLSNLPHKQRYTNKQLILPQQKKCWKVFQQKKPVILVPPSKLDHTEVWVHLPWPYVQVASSGLENSLHRNRYKWCKQWPLTIMMFSLSWN